MSEAEKKPPESGAFSALAELEVLIVRFESGTLPKAEWTHQAHLLVGLWYVFHHGKEKATLLMRDGVRRYNDATGTPNTATSGYHETITLFFIWFLDSFLKRTDRQRPLNQIADELLEKHSDRNLPLRYYSKERLMSVEARFGWIEPDLQPLLL